jgi:hypothetical protein
MNVRKNMKHHLYQIALPLLVLSVSACSGTNMASSLSLDSSLVTLAMQQPNRLILQAMMTMMDGQTQATKTTVNSTVAIAQNLEITQDEASFVQDIAYASDITLDMTTNALLSSNPQLSLAFLLNRFSYEQTAGYNDDVSSQTMELRDQSLAMFYDQGYLYVNTSSAQDLAAAIELNFLPTQFKTYLGSPEELNIDLGNFVNPDTHDTIEAILPMLEMIPLLRHRIEGQALIVEYAITQNDIPEILTSVYQQGLEQSVLTSEDEALLAEAITVIQDILTITTFSITVRVDIPLMKVTSLDINIDLAITDDFSETSFVWNPENPNANQDGYVEVTFNSSMQASFQVNTSMIMEYFSDLKPLTLPTDIDNYVTI